MNELEKLKKMLKEAGIPYKVVEDHPIPNVVIHSKKDDRTLCDAIISPFGNDDSLEIMGAMTVDEYGSDHTLAGLKAEEVFKRFKYCYAYDTSTYL